MIVKVVNSHQSTYGLPANRLSQMLSEISNRIKQFVDITWEQSDAIALWIAFTYCYDLFEINPRLAILSPTKRCGKTILELLVHMFLKDADFSSNISPAGIYTRDSTAPLLIDEYDSFGKKYPELRNIYNNGHREGTAYVDRKGIKYKVYYPLAIASINKLHGTMMDRSIKIMVHRKPVELKLPKIPKHNHKKLIEIQHRINETIGQYVNEIETANPEPPVGLSSDRSYDNWGPLFAIARVAGAEWLEYAKQSCLSLESDPEEDESVEIIRAIAPTCSALRKKNQKHVETEVLVNAANEVGKQESAEWAPISAKKLGLVLRLFEVRPDHYRVPVDQNQAKTPEGNKPNPVFRRGYQLEKLCWLFPRYGAASTRPCQEPVTSDTPDTEDVGFNPS